MKISPENAPPGTKFASLCRRGVNLAEQFEVRRWKKDQVLLSSGAWARPIDFSPSGEVGNAGVIRTHQNGKFWVRLTDEVRGSQEGKDRAEEFAELSNKLGRLLRKTKQITENDLLRLQQVILEFEGPQ